MAIASEQEKLVFRKMERDLVRLRKSQEPDAVHSFRTTSRRLQVLLEELTPSTGRKEKKLLKILGRIRKRAGKIRDLDIQLAALRSLKMPLEPRRKTQLMHRLIELRHKHERRLEKLLTRREVAQISKRIRQAAKASHGATIQDPLKVSRQLLSHETVPTASAINDEYLHRFRLKVKRARYAAEFAPKSPESQQAIAQLKHLQDVLGQWHDWFTLTQSAARKLGDITRSSLVAALHNVTRGKFREAVSVVMANSSHPTASVTRSVRRTNSGDLHITAIDTAA